MQLIHFVAFVALLGAAYAQPVALEAPASQLEDVADLGADQPKEGDGARSPRWLWGGLGGWGGGWNSGWGGGWNRGWEGGHTGGWGGGWTVSYRPWSSGSSYWW